MTTDAHEQETPHERLVRVSDWNALRRDMLEMRETMVAMGDRQLEMLEVVKGFGILHDEVIELRRSLTVRMWLPTVANTIVLLLNVIFVLWMRQ